MNINITEYALSIIDDEISEIQQLKQRIDEKFITIINEILSMSGKLILIGVGKNAPIAQKMVATLNSTGTPAQFLHAGEALHGDLGMINKEDICLILSKSGNTPEIKSAFPSIKSLCKSTVAITGNKESFLSKNAHHTLDTTISKEAGPYNLAPTSSTTVQLVLCDAIAMTLMKAKNFDPHNFSQYHPGGSLGRQLLLTIHDLLDDEQKPQVNLDSSIKDVIQSLSSGRHGITAVMENGKVIGVITDGDLRRMLEKYTDLSGLIAKDIASFNPKFIYENELATEALRQINQYNIGQLIVLNKDDEYAGIIDFHGLIKEGISAE